MQHCFIAIILLNLILMSCTPEATSIDTSDFNPNIEIAEEVEIIYSDSAKLQYIMRTPRLEIYSENNVTVERFPKGIYIELYNAQQELSSTMVAEYAEKRSSQGTLLLRDNVVLTNAQKDELTTIGIVWNENRQTLVTDKFVRLVKAATQDTLYGYGLEARQDFSHLKIKRFRGKRSSESNDVP